MLIRSVNVEDYMILNKLNLQLFASDEDDDFDYDDDIDDVDDVEEDDDLEEDDQELDSEDETEVDDDEDTKDKNEQPKKKDKVTQALIKQKKLNRQLKEQLDSLTKQERETEKSQSKKLIIDRYIEKGYDEDEAIVEAEKFLENEEIKSTVKKLQFMTENADLMRKYPEAAKNIDKLMKIQKSTGWSMNKICKAEYALNENAYDAKIRNDQQNKLNKKRVSMTPSGSQTPIQSMRLDSDDEKAYQFYAKKNPGVSRKQYAKNILQGQKAQSKIPHDKWD
jgi:hypothetical protein